MTALWCLAADRCRGHAAGEPEQATRTPLCDTCLDTAPRDITVLPLDYRDLEQLIPPAISVWGDGTPHSTDGHSPIRLGVEALQRQIWALTTIWEEVLRDRHRLSDPAWRRPAPTRRIFAGTAAGDVLVLQRTVRVEHPTALARPMRPGLADIDRALKVITPRLDLLANIGPVTVQDYPLMDEDNATVFRGHIYEQVSGARGILDLVATHARARSVLGLTAPVRRLPGHCSRCHRPDLRQDQPREAGDEQPVVCGSCGLSMTYDDYQQRTNVLRKARAA